jgi:hypothetical protein
MAKYYCVSGNFKNIIDCPNLETALKRSVLKLIDTQKLAAPLMMISEKGFNSREYLLTPVIPVMKELNLNLPSDEELAIVICQALNTTPDKISPKELQWYLTGELE